MNNLSHVPSMRPPLRGGRKMLRKELGVRLPAVETASNRGAPAPLPACPDRVQSIPSNDPSGVIDAQQPGASPRASARPPRDR